MEKLFTFLFAAVFIVFVWFGAMWGLWLLWCWVLPQLYVGGPHNLLAPCFWLFAGAWTLTASIGNAIFGGGKSK